MAETMTPPRGTVSVRDAGLCGMITLRADPVDPAVRDACCGVTGAAFPEIGKICLADDTAIGWMSPDEVLLMLPHDRIEGALVQIRSALIGQHHLAVDVSDARCVLSLEGPLAREILGKLTPVELHPSSFGPGDLRRSRLGQIAAAFWMPDDSRITVVCFRSVGDYAIRLLSQSASDGAVGYY